MVNQPELPAQQKWNSIRRGLRALGRRLAFKSLLIYLLWALGLGLILASYLDWEGSHHTGFIPVDVRPHATADYTAPPEHPMIESLEREPIR